MKAGHLLSRIAVVLVVAAVSAPLAQARGIDDWFRDASATRQVLVSSPSAALIDDWFRTPGMLRALAGTAPSSVAVDDYFRGASVGAVTQTPVAVDDYFRGPALAPASGTGFDWGDAGIGAASGFAALAAVAVPTAGATDSTVVSLVACAIGGGTTTVPAGVPITIHEPGYAQGSYGLIQDFLLKEHTTLTISNATSTVYDLSGEWSAPQQLDRNLWVTRLPSTDTGITLASGQSINATFDITFSQPLLVAFPPVTSSGDNGPFLVSEDGPISCLITAS